jgi:uridine kinase
VTSRAQVLSELTDRILAVRSEHPVRVAVDGCSAAGKSTLADELGAVLEGKTDRTVIRVGIDLFKRAVELRTGYPAGSPESYYHEMFDTDAIRRELLLPLGPGGDRRYRTQVMDIRGRTPVDSGVQEAPRDAILVADGAFLQKPVLDPHWDLRIYLDIGFDDVLRRGVARDQAWMGSAAAAEERYRIYYIPGERLYLDEVRPAGRPDVVVDNRDFAAPRITTPLRGRRSRGPRGRR